VRDAVHTLETRSQAGSGEQGLYGDRLELLGGGQHLGIEPAQLADRRDDRDTCPTGRPSGLPGGRLPGYQDITGTMASQLGHKRTATRGKD